MLNVINGNKCNMILTWLCSFFVKLFRKFSIENLQYIQSWLFIIFINFSPFNKGIRKTSTAFDGSSWPLSPWKKVSNWDIKYKIKWGFTQTQQSSLTIISHKSHYWNHLQHFLDIFSSQSLEGHSDLDWTRW